MSDQTLFGFARMSAAEYRDDCQQGRVDLSTSSPTEDGNVAIRAEQRAEAGIPFFYKQGSGRWL